MAVDEVKVVVGGWLVVAGVIMRFMMYLGERREKREKMILSLSRKFHISYI